MIDSNSDISWNIPTLTYQAVTVQQSGPMTLTIWTLGWTDADRVTVVYPEGGTP